MGTRDDRDDEVEETERAKQHFVQGVGLLFRAATEAAGGIKKELERTDVGKQLDVAGRELYRAANNVVTRVGMDLFFNQKDKDKEKKDDESKRWEDDPPRYAPGEKPKGPTKEDPGFRIATNDDDPK